LCITVSCGETSFCHVGTTSRMSNKSCNSDCAAELLIHSRSITKLIHDSYITKWRTTWSYFQCGRPSTKFYKCTWHSTENKTLWTNVLTACSEDKSVCIETTLQAGRPRFYSWHGRDFWTFFFPPPPSNRVRIPPSLLSSGYREHFPWD